MTPDRIKISKEFHVMGSGLWLSLEMPIIPGDDVTKEFIEGNRQLNAAFKAINPAAHFEEATTTYPIVNPSEINIQSEKTLIAIENSTTIPELEKHFHDALKYGLKDEYNKRLKELS